jgi:hypothetical protein
VDLLAIDLMGTTTLRFGPITVEAQDLILLYIVEHIMQDAMRTPVLPMSRSASVDMVDG